jgi:hypothetical protein
VKAFLVLIVLLLAAAAPAQVDGEWLMPPDRETLHPIESVRNSLKMKTVYVGRGETTENWTRRITTWSYPGRVDDRAAFAESMVGLRQDILADCPDATASPLRLFDWADRPAAEFGVVCMRYPITGRSDIYVVRVIQGRTGRIAAAITFRRPPTDAETGAARAYLDTLLLCTPASALTACRR